MAQFVCNGAQIQCSFGAAPMPLSIIDPTRPKISNLPMANIMDFAPSVNVPPFGMCKNPANPTVASATAAAMGVLTPMPCIPVTTAPWTPGSAIIKISNFPALLNNCKCMCAYGGIISINNPGNSCGATGK